MNKLNTAFTLALPFLILFAAAFACGDEKTKVNTGSNSAEVKTADSSSPDSAVIRRVTVNQKKTFNGLDITIGEIAIEKGKVTIGMTIANTGKDPLSFYPNQHSIVIGKKQLDSSFINNGGQVSGEINAGIERSDSITFDDKQGGIDPSAVTQIGLRLGNVLNMKVFKSVDVNWDIDLPKP